MFTYNTSTTVGKVRLEIGDNQIEPNGILPDGRNFSDDEITAFFTEEGSVLRTAARCLEVASRRWARVPKQQTTGSESSSQETASHLLRQALELRRRYGHTNRTIASGSVRVDAEPWKGPQET